MVKEKKTVICFVLDESGSMGPVRYETIKGINEYIETIQSEEKNILIKFLSFNSGGIRTLFDYVPVKQVKPLNEKDYHPQKSTPLYDSIGYGITNLDEYLLQNDENINVIFTILTDGLENSSIEYDRNMIFKLITDRQENNWIFTFLGANQDSWEAAEYMGLKKDFVADYEGSRPDKAMFVEAKRAVWAKSKLDRNEKIDRYYRERDKRDLLSK